VPAIIEYPAIVKNAVKEYGSVFANHEACRAVLRQTLGARLPAFASPAGSPSPSQGWLPALPRHTGSGQPSPDLPRDAAAVYTSASKAAWR